MTYLHGDHLGSTSKTTGAASSAQLYEAYGAKRGSSEVDTPYRYTGQRREENDALDIYYYKARWYDPALGRFLQPDLFVPEPRNPQSLNRYAYCLNNPVKYTDPTGHQAGALALQPPMTTNEIIGILEAAAALAVAAPEGAAIAVGAAAAATGAATLAAAEYLAVRWALAEPNNLDYDVPEFQAGSVQPTYGVGAGRTVTIDTTVAFSAERAVQSAADHMGFLFQYGGAGLPGFPNPWNRHNPKKTNSPRKNAEHIRNALEGIKQNLGKQDLRTYLQQQLAPEQYQSFTQHLDNLIFDLQNQGYFYEQFGSKLSGDILRLLEDVGYVVSQAGL